MTDGIVNKVAQSGIITLDLEDWIKEENFTGIDLKDQLWQGLALKEKDFRAWVKEHDWSQYSDQHVYVYCSADAIIPVWAFMLVTSKLNPHTKSVTHGTEEDSRKSFFEGLFHDLDTSTFEDARMVIKGCGDGLVPSSVYTLAVSRLQPLVKSLMFGEPCSTVPVYKKPRIKA